MTERSEAVQPARETGRPGGAAPGTGRSSRRPSDGSPLRRVRRDVADGPFIVIWEATRACPLACLHCRAEAVPDRHPEELTTAEAGELIRQMADFGRPAPLFVPDIARLVCDQGALLRSVFFLVPTGRGRALSALSPPEAEDVLHFLYDLGTTIPVKTTEAHHFRRVAVQRLILAEHGADHAETLGPLYRNLCRRARRSGLIRDSRVRRPPVDVNAGRGFVFVSHTGTVHPSGFLPLGAGNVRDRPLTEIYRSAPLFAALRDPDRLGGRCGACEFRTICGGSRSRAYACTGDVLAEEPWCGYEPGSFPYQSDLARHLHTP
ncbi:hypothetical protein Aple_023310 [Acrocarpospora pleiomorpha]|uniref:Radical SAM protein n=1 Tax=Acrocarpospora pleiomorpha TaxID=90975 RepID=A0A5M3XCQ0_9ACTN|nr:radical SAM/SPASM domain-containing protein [Acrocarpospora pleiomorpha]GES19435.1 hypothetical protein Aple_023310 [Acrocarpospora pleiomorpha]